MPANKVLRYLALGLVAGLGLWPALAGGSSPPAPLPATEPMAPPANQDFRISTMGPAGDTRFFALDPAVAYNDSANEYLVVWAADDDTTPLVNDEFEVYGQRIDAASSVPIGPRVRISDMGPDGDPAYGAYDPAVAYNGTDSEYLVVWQGDDTVAGELEIYGQRLDAGGNEIGPNDFRLSDMGPAGDPAFDALNPAVAYNSTADEYLVVWHGDDVADNVVEIYGQRLAADGSEIGTDDFAISDMGTDPGDGRFRGQDAAVAYNSTTDQYLVVWEGDDDIPPLVDSELEIFGQRLAADGSEVGPNDFRLSNMGPDGDPAYAADNPAVAYNDTARQYLVVWSGDDNRDWGGGPLADNEIEVYGQRLATNGDEIGANDFRISFMGPDGDSNFKTFGAEVRYIASLREYLVVWRGDDNTPPLVLGELEIFGQWLAAGGASVGPRIRLSDMGPDGDPNYDADRPAVATHAADGTLLVVWQGDDNTGSLVEGEVEIFGRHYANPRAANLVLTMTVTPLLAAPGQPITYTLAFANRGPSLARGVVLTDIVPLTLTQVQVVSSGVAITDTGASPPYVWLVRALAPGQAGAITVSGELSPCLRAGSFANTATITTTAKDTAPGDNSAVAIVTIVNLPPVASSDGYSTPEDTPLVVAAPGVLSNDGDLNCDPLTALPGSLPAHGTLSLDPDGSFAYDPGPDFSGGDSFTYVASDGELTATATVALTVTAVNDAPVAVADAYTTTEDTPLVVPAATGVLSNDSDPDGDPLTAALDRPPAHGVVLLDTGGSFTYTPTHSFAGSDSFAYLISDGYLTDTALVTVTVQPVGEADIVVAPLSLQVVLGPGQQARRQVTIGNVGDAGLTWTLAEDPAVGWLTEAPVSGTLAPSDSLAVDVAFDAGGLAAGTYSTTLTIASNDPDEPLVTVDTTLVVTTSCIPAHNASFASVPAAPEAWQVVTLTASADGSVPLAFDWNLGDGSTAVGGVVEHTYDAAGDYLVTMTATNDCGGDIFSATIRVYTPCQALEIIDVTTDTAGCAVAFGANLGGDPPFSYAWNFAAYGSSSEPSPTVDFPGSGTYAYELVVHNCSGRYFDTYAGQVTVDCGVCAPVTQTGFTWTPLTPTVSLPVTFTGQAQGSTPITFTWDFGDTGHDSGATATHTYATTGTYIVTLTTENACGVDQAVRTLVVRKGPANHIIYLPLVFKSARP